MKLKKIVSYLKKFFKESIWNKKTNKINTLISNNIDELGIDDLIKKVRKIEKQIDTEKLKKDFIPYLPWKRLTIENKWLRELGPVYEINDIEDSI